MEAFSIVFTILITLVIGILIGLELERSALKLLKLRATRALLPRPPSGAAPPSVVMMSMKKIWFGGTLISTTVNYA